MTDTLSISEMGRALERMTGRGDIRMGGDFARDGLEWYAERSFTGHRSLTVYLPRQHRRQFKLWWTGTQAASPLEQLEFVAQVAPVLGCGRTLLETLEALAALEERVRELPGCDCIITEGWRCPFHDAP